MTAAEREAYYRDQRRRTGYPEDGSRVHWPPMEEFKRMVDAQKAAWAQKKEQSGGTVIDGKTGRRVIATPRERLTPKQLKELEDYDNMDWEKRAGRGPPHYTLKGKDGAPDDDVHEGLGRKRQRGGLKFAAGADREKLLAKYRGILQGNGRRRR